jgi:mxaJ protein
VVWGPAAAHFAHRRNLQVQPASAPAGLEVPFEFAIAVGVRRGNRELRDALDAALERRKHDVDAILDEYRVPRL